MKKTIAQLFEDFHTEIMVQTARGCHGVDFTNANRIYQEFVSRSTRQEIDGFSTWMGVSFLVGMIIGLLVARL